MTEAGTAGDPLLRRWTVLCLPLGLDVEAGWAGLQGHYGQPHRAYHNLAHIADCLRQLDAHQADVQDPVALEMAIWFHDIIYDPHSSENELKSAEQAEAFLRGTSLGPSVRTLILATRHRDEALTGDAGLIADIDLSILGAESSVYRRYAAAIRTEYSFVPEEQYAKGRTDVLMGFLKRPHLFATALFRQSLESAARKNLADEIDSLASSG